MTYAVGEAAILTLIRALTAYNTTNSARCDWRILHSGVSKYYAIVYPGEAPIAQHTISTNIRTWRSVVQLWRRYSDDAETLNIEGDMDTVIAQLEKYPTLDGASGVVDANITGTGAVEVVELKHGSAATLWLRWEVYLDWQEEVEISYAE